MKVQKAIDGIYQSNVRGLVAIGQAEETTGSQPGEGSGNCTPQVTLDNVWRYCGLSEFGGTQGVLAIGIQ